MYSCEIEPVRKPKEDGSTPESVSYSLLLLALTHNVYTSSYKNWQGVVREVWLLLALQNCPLHKQNLKQMKLEQNID